MRRREKRALTINVYLPPGVAGDINLITEGQEQIMGKIDEVQAQFDDLDRAVRDFMAQGSPNVEAIQAELDALRADDQVEDTKLDALGNGIQNLKQAMDNLKPHVDNTLPGDLPGDQGMGPR